MAAGEARPLLYVSLYIYIPIKKNQTFKEPPFTFFPTSIWSHRHVWLARHWAIVAAEWVGLKMKSWLEVSGLHRCRRLKAVGASQRALLAHFSKTTKLVRESAQQLFGEASETSACSGVIFWCRSSAEEEEDWVGCGGRGGLVLHSQLFLMSKESLRIAGPPRYFCPSTADVARSPAAWRSQLLKKHLIWGAGGGAQGHARDSDRWRLSPGGNEQ